MEYNTIKAVDLVNGDNKHVEVGGNLYTIDSVELDGDKVKIKTDPYTNDDVEVVVDKDMEVKVGFSFDDADEAQDYLLTHDSNFRELQSSLEGDC